MTLDRYTPDQIRAYEQELLVRVPTDAPVGNVTLRSQLALLDWSESLYWDIRKHLIDRGVLALGRGKGGSVRRVAQAPTQAPDADVSALATTISATTVGSTTHHYVPEKDLYVPMAKVIEQEWARDRNFDSVVVEITAQQGANLGKWTRPDITVASSRTFPYIPGRHFEVITFEIKAQDHVNVTAVYEALAHRRAATRSYVLLHVPQPLKAALETVIEETCSEAKQHGIGVIIAEIPCDYDTWEEQVEAEQRQPDPERLNDFLAEQVTLPSREKIMRWLK